MIIIQGCFYHQAKKRAIRIGEKMKSERSIPDETFIEEVFLNLGPKEIDINFHNSSYSILRISFYINWKERFEMLKEVNLHRQCYNRKHGSKRGSNNSAGRPNSVLGPGIWLFRLRFSVPLDWNAIETIVTSPENHASGSSTTIPTMEGETECVKLHMIIIFSFQF